MTIKSLEIDFCSPAFERKLKSASQGAQPFKKALLLSGKTGSVLDAMGGRGQDAMLMASWGFHVSSFERNPDVWQQLSEALRKLEENPSALAHSFLESHLSFHFGDALFSSDLQEASFDIVYVDPMYPPKKKSASSSKEVIHLRDIVGSGKETLEEVIQRALDLCSKKVVVKRPIHEEIPFIPSHSYKGTSTRYDVFLKSAKLRKTS